jgi:hypothetical protein
MYHYFLIKKNKMKKLDAHLIIYKQFVFNQVYLYFYIRSSYMHVLWWQPLWIFPSTQTANILQRLTKEYSKMVQWFQRRIILNIFQLSGFRENFPINFVKSV